MIWPSGFVRTHKKETLEYQSDQSLHNGKHPYLPVKIQGGVIIDLQTTAIETQVSQLLDIDELKPDEILRQLLQSEIASLGQKQNPSITSQCKNINLLE